MNITFVMLRGKFREYSFIIKNSQRFIDPFILVSLAFLLFNDNKIVFNFNYFIIFLIDFFVLNFNNIYESYRIDNLNKLIPQIFFISSSFTLINCFLLGYDLFYGTNPLKIFLIISFSYLFLQYYLFRFLLRFIRIRGWNTRNIIFFGNDNSLKKFLEQLKNNPWSGYRLVYWFSPNKKEKENFISNSISCSGGPKELIKKINSEKIDKVFFCHHYEDDISLESMISVIGDTCISASFVMDWNISSMSLKKEYLGDLVAINIWNPDFPILNEKIKRIFDFVFGIILLITFFPFFILISASILLSSKGPILFSQYRYGINGKIFKMYKFRTMYVQKNSKTAFIKQAKKYDRRVTKIGKFLRRYSIDELPQLINVIKGEMSLVGPRPHASQHNEYYRKLITGYMQRHSTLPGITGLAQIKGARGETNTIEKMKLRIKYDTEYNNNWSLQKDFVILLKTILVIFKGNAY